MSRGCNSCKFLDENAKKPGRSGGYLYLCTAKGSYVDATDDECGNYDEDLARSSATMNEIYRDSDNYDDSVNTHGCNSCANLNIEAKKSGSSCGAVYFCEKKGTYVSGANNACELYEEGSLTLAEMNDVYRDGESYDDSNGSMKAYLVVLIFLIILGLICGVFFK